MWCDNWAKSIATFLTALGLSGLTCTQTGCWAPEGPKTEFSINPITKTLHFKDTKDNDIQIDDLVFDGTAKTASVRSLKIRNNASDVIAQQIEQMKVWNEQMRTANEGIAQTMLGLTNLAATLTKPLIGASMNVEGQTPLGSGQGTVHLGGSTTQPAPHEE